MPGGLKPLMVLTGSAGGLVHRWAKRSPQGDAEIAVM